VPLPSPYFFGVTTPSQQTAVSSALEQGSGPAVPLRCSIRCTACQQCGAVSLCCAALLHEQIGQGRFGTSMCRLSQFMHTKLSAILLVLRFAIRTSRGRAGHVCAAVAKPPYIESLGNSILMFVGCLGRPARTMTWCPSHHSMSLEPELPFNEQRSRAPGY
jgi:hypothetical protein